MLLVAVGMLSAAGCGSDERAPIVEEMVRQIDIAGAKVKGIRLKVEEAVTQANKKAEKEKREVKTTDLTLADLQVARDAVKGLKEVSAGYLEEARKAQSIVDSITKEQQEKFAQEFGSKVQTEMAELQREQEKLSDAIVAAEKINPAATKELREKLLEANAEFESLAKRN